MPSNNWPNYQGRNPELQSNDGIVLHRPKGSNTLDRIHHVLRLLTAPFALGLLVQAIIVVIKIRRMNEALIAASVICFVVDLGAFIMIAKRRSTFAAFYMRLLWFLELVCIAVLIVAIVFVIYGPNREVGGSWNYCRSMGYTGAMERCRKWHGVAEVALWQCVALM